MNLSQDPEIRKELKKEELCYCSDSESGFFRQKFSKNFQYYDLKGKRIKDKKILERITSLVIPPAWKNVWVCPKTNGHLQATGIDEKGRKQYIYHPDWIKITKQNKFSKMVDFGLSLPLIREKIRYFMQIRNLDKKKVLATVVWLLEHTFMRVGNDEYAKENDSFGLTTLRSKHVSISGDEIRFRFKGKSGINHLIKISQPTVAKTIRRCVELPGYELFQFIDEEGKRHVIDSKDVNEFLKEVAGHDFSAKDFRTWGGTEISANNFYKLGYDDNKAVIKKNISDTVKVVADHLGNTVTVCRNYYIHPTVIKTYSKNVLVPYFNRHKGKSVKGLQWDEYALVKLLQKYS